MSHLSVTQKAAVRKALLDWYDKNARSLPWRVGPADKRGGRRPDPYQVWLSEIMLQQTTTAHAAPYFLRFTQTWPTVFDLAAAPDAEVMSAWAGLGYYARARNLLACARKVAGQLDGRFPDQEAQLLTLPGVGAYTAAALTAIAFDRAANVVDGNVERVVARLFALKEALPSAKPALKSLAAGLVDEDRPGDWAQALMDLGATICTPTSPRCRSCPLSDVCQAFGSGEPQRYPLKSPKAARPRRYGVAYVALRADQVALVQRAPKGLLGGMLGLPTSSWGAQPVLGDQRLGSAPGAAVWRELGSIDHVFTHFSLTLDVFGAETGEAWSDVIWWSAEAALTRLPTVFRKVLELGLKALDPSA